MPENKCKTYKVEVKDDVCQSPRPNALICVNCRFRPRPERSEVPLGTESAEEDAPNETTEVETETNEEQLEAEAAETEQEHAREETDHIAEVCEETERGPEINEVVAGDET